MYVLCLCRYRYCGRGGGNRYEKEPPTLLAAGKKGAKNEKRKLPAQQTGTRPQPQPRFFSSVRMPASKAGVMVCTYLGTDKQTCVAGPRAWRVVEHRACGRLHEALALLQSLNPVISCTMARPCRCKWVEQLHTCLCFCFHALSSDSLLGAVLLN